MTHSHGHLVLFGVHGHTQEARDLAAYGMIILQLARKHGGMGWLVYDRQFQQHRAAGASMPWSDIYPSLMAATVLGKAGDGSGRSCRCVLPLITQRRSVLWGSVSSPNLVLIPPPFLVHFLPPVAHFTARLHIPRTGDTICRRFNRGCCTRSTCRFDHICTGCVKPGHGEIHCPDSKVKQRSKISDARSAGLPKPTHPLPPERA